MKNTFNISIKKPCSENFNDFNKTELGGFCNSCSKEVIDFTKKSDKEVLAYFTAKKGNTCGHFYTNQLKTYSDSKSFSEQKKYNFIGAIGFSIISLVSNTGLNAQEKKTNTIITATTKKEKSILILNNDVLKGTVYSNYDKYPLPGVSIVLKNTIVGTETDFDGNFKLKNIKEGDILSFYYLGYKTQEIVIAKNQTSLKIFMEEDTSILGGLVVAGEVNLKTTYKTKRSFWQRIKSIF